jgi:hypothetical protein
MIIIGCDYHPGFQQIACFRQLLSLPQIIPAMIIPRWHSNYVLPVLQSGRWFCALSTVRRALSAKQTERKCSSEKTHILPRKLRLTSFGDPF